MEKFLTDNTLYLFCDASILKLEDTDNIYLGCPGVVVAEYINGELKPLYFRSKLIFDSTNNNSEITAILLGVYEAINNRSRYKKIKLLSDSLICISSLRSWIFSWVQNSRNGILYSSSGQPAANQDVIKCIIQTIVNNNLNIEFYHQKGHVTSTERSLNEAKTIFFKSNNILLDDNEIKSISVFNDSIDKYTKKQLLENHNNRSIRYNLINPFTYDLYDCNFETYKKLIERRNG